MKYPKPVMKMSELKKMGLPEEHLLYAFRLKTQDFAWKSNPTKINSPILFDTEKYETWRQRQCM